MILYKYFDTIFSPVSEKIIYKHLYNYHTTKLNKQIQGGINMVSALKFYNRDPMFPTMDRGRGHYYYRGDLARGTIKGHSGPYWSKYDEYLDASKAHKPKKVNNIGKNEEKHPHKADYKTRVRDGRIDKTRKTTRAGTGPRGYF